MNRRRMMFNKIEPSSSLLPKGFRQVEYIESTGTQYIDTGVPFQNSPRFVGKFKFTKNTNGNILGAYVGSSVKIYISFSTSDENLIKTVGSYCNYGSENKPHYLTIGDWHTFDFGGGYFIVDGVKRTFSYSFIAWNNTSFALFGRRNGSKYEPSPMIISELKIFNNQDAENPIRDFIPCYRESDGVAGMYDLSGSICSLTGTPFYINAGTGEFLKGADI